MQKIYGLHNALVTKDIDLSALYRGHRFDGILEIRRIAKKYKSGNSGGGLFGHIVFFILQFLKKARKIRSDSS